MSKITSLSHFKSEASQLISEISKSGESIVITQNGEASAVLQDIESYNKLQEALLMLKLLATSESDMQKGKLTEHKELFKSLKQKLKSND